MNGFENDEFRISHYLEKYDDSSIAKLVPDTKKKGISAREFAEMLYLPFMIADEALLLFSMLEALSMGRVIFDLYRRVWELYGEKFPFSEDDFSGIAFNYNENVRAVVLNLPDKDIKPGDFLKIFFITEKTSEDIHIAVVEQGEDRFNYVSVFDMMNLIFTRTAVAPRDFEALKDIVAECTFDKSENRCHNIEKQCPICHEYSSIELSNDEMTAYSKASDENGSLEEALPELDEFMIEFLRTGMCIMCQGVHFGKPLPDYAKWMM